MPALLPTLGDRLQKSGAHVLFILAVSIGPLAVAQAGDELSAERSAEGVEPKPAQLLPNETEVSPTVNPVPLTNPNDFWMVEPIPARERLPLQPLAPLYEPVLPVSAQEPFSLGGRLVDRNLAFGTQALDTTVRTARPRRRGGSSFRRDQAPLRIGPLDLTAALTVSALNESIRRQSNGDGGWFFSTAVSPSIEGELGVREAGRYVSFGYDATRTFGGDEDRDGKLDQSLSLEAHYDFSRLKLALLGDYQSDSGPDRDSGGSAERNTVNLMLTAGLPLSLKTSVDAEVQFTSNDYPEGISSESYSAAVFVNRKLSLKSTLGLGATLGKLDVQDDAGQTYQQINLRGSFSPTQKLSFSGSLGVEFRQTENEDQARPIFALNAVYALRPQTQLGLDLTRGSMNSAAQPGSNYESTTATLSLSQQFGPRIRANLAVGVQSSIYETVSGAGDDGREDLFFFVQPRISYRVNEHCTLSMFYVYSHNDSDEARFEQQQLGLNATYLF